MSIHLAIVLVGLHVASAKEDGSLMRRQLKSPTIQEYAKEVDTLGKQKLMRHVDARITAISADGDVVAPAGTLDAGVPANMAVSSDGSTAIGADGNMAFLHSSDHAWHRESDGRHGHWHGHIHNVMEESYNCHEECGTDSECHSECPDVWGPFVDACSIFKSCLAACKDGDCAECSESDVKWMNAYLRDHPERVKMMAERACPIVEKAYTCHQACSPGDFDCHHKCPSLRRKHADDDADDDDDKDEVDKGKQIIEKVHACHEKCVSDGECHLKCSRPLAQLVKVCRDAPGVKACHEDCVEEECDRCPRFELDWMNRIYTRYPDPTMEKVEAICPVLQASHDCHRACNLYDRECHHECPSVFHSEYGRGVDQNSEQHEPWHVMMRKAHSCHDICGADRDCHSKCPKPWRPFVKACQEFSALQKCTASCTDEDCDKCGKLDVDWMKKIYTSDPDRFKKMAEATCPMVENAHACHHKCEAGDQECHHRCPSMFHDHTKPFWHKDMERLHNLV